VKTTETPYTAKDISLNLDIGDSTLRKWCLALEEHGYNFYRTDQNKRLFTEKDIIVLKHFQQLVKEKNMSMNNASLIVTSRFKKVPFSSETEVEQLESEMNNVPAMRSDTPLIQELLQKIETMEEQQNQLIQMNKALFNRLDEQQKYIEERMNKRDSDLLQSLRESQETKQLLLEVKEMQETQQKKPRRGILSFFSRD
jgi:DNA polymerase II small subunit/DNA polymerase delta subunit B